jgi:hypothetical protein
VTLWLKDIWPITKPNQYKLHFARWNRENQPLEVFVRDKIEWRGWQEYRPSRNDFNRPFIFSVMSFYHETDTWLFGGIFRVVKRSDNRYEVELSNDGNGLIGRLKLLSPYRVRTTRVNFENHYTNFVVKEVLREPYSGRHFPGYEGIDISFEELEALVRNEPPDWKSALESVKGIYLISDTKTGRRYVGSAYGDLGVWSRWSSYAHSGHGGNAELRMLVKDPTLQYCRCNFRFALLEHRAVATSDDIVLDRESYWKRILLTRGDYGLNRN